MASTPSSFSHWQTWTESSSGVAGLLFRQQRVVEFRRADLHLQVKVRADARADRLDDLADELRAVGQHAAVFVGAIVDTRAEKLRDQVAVGAVQFHAVEARLARASCALGKRLHGFFDLRERHRLAFEAMQRIVFRGRA